MDWPVLQLAESVIQLSMIIMVGLYFAFSNTIMPALTIGRCLTDMVEGQDLLELSAMIKDEARVFSFIAKVTDEGEVSALQLPEDSRVICIYRNDKFMMVNEDTSLKKNDEVVVLSHSRNLPELQKRLSTPSISE